MLALRIRNLKKTYKNGVSALKGIDLDVNEGEFFSLLGKNGAGKSTTIGIISSLVIKTAGEVLVYGHDIDKDTRKAKSLIGVVPQEMNFNVFEKVSDILLTQAGYYGIPKNIAMQRMTFHLNEMDLWHKRDQPAVNLSGGMKRRLMIARAMMNEPKLLILDEPTSGIDVELRYALWQYLKKLNEHGTTIILTTHYFEEVEQLCQRVAIIDHGEIIENTDLKPLLRRLQTETLVLEFANPLMKPPILPNFPYHFIDETTLEVETSKENNINELVGLLTTQGHIIINMRNKTNRLEQLFLRIVARNTS